MLQKVQKVQKLQKLQGLKIVNHNHGIGNVHSDDQEEN